MISRISGKLVRLIENEALIDVGAFEYQVFVPEFVRRQLQPSVGEKVTLRTIEYLEGNPQQGRLVPRLIGFNNDIEREFFDMICSVDGVGVKKALRSMVRPVPEVAAAIEEGDLKQLSTLPGVGPAVAERIVAKLRRKMARFALMVARELPAEAEVDRDVFSETLEALISLGHTAAEARQKIDAATGGSKKFKTAEDLIAEIYRRERPQ